MSERHRASVVIMPQLCIFWKVVFSLSLFCFLFCYHVFLFCCVLLLWQQIVAEQSRSVWGEEGNTWNKPHCYISIKFATSLFHSLRFAWCSYCTIMSNRGGCGSGDSVVVYQSWGWEFDLRLFLSIWFGLVLTLRLSVFGKDTEPQVALGGSGHWLAWQRHHHRCV